MDAVNDEPFAGRLVGNVGEPTRLKELNLAGVSAAPAKGGDTAKIWTRMPLTSAVATLKSGHTLASTLTR